LLLLSPYIRGGGSAGSGRKPAAVKNGRRKEKISMRLQFASVSKAVHSKFPAQNPKWGSGGKAADWRKYVILREISVSKGEV